MRRCCLCGKEHGQCSAFTLVRDLGPWPWNSDAIPREVCQRCSDLNSVLWGDTVGLPLRWRLQGLFLKMMIARWLLLLFRQNPEDWLIGLRR